MSVFEKTVYIEVEAADADDAEEQISVLADAIGAYANVLNVDIAGPMEAK